MSETKRGRGRPKGSGGKKTFVHVPLETLGQLAGPNCVIPVSRVWWEQMGGVVDKTSVVAAPQTVADHSQAIEFSIEE